MEYTLRKLKASDMGIVCKIISGIGVKEFKKCINIDDLKDESNATQFGLDILFDIGGIIIANIPRVQNDVDEFLASLTGMKISDIKNMDFAEYGELIITVVQKDEFKDFFKRVMLLFNP